MFKNLFRKKEKKQKAVVFVDFEHWYYSYKNIFKMRPNIEEWYDEIKNDFLIQQVLVFGDFSEVGIASELGHLESITKNIIHTVSSKEGVDKDFTDFIILDYIYQYAAKPDSADIFILFTGDGHFDSVVRYLKNMLNKKVILYGVKRAFSGKLKSVASSYVEMPRQIQEKGYYNELILKSLDNLYNTKPDKLPTYWKTVRTVAEYNGVLEEKIQFALDELLDKKYILEKEICPKPNMKMRILEVCWDKLNSDGLWQNSNIV